MSYGYNWSHDDDVDVWYFTLSDAEVCHTETLGSKRTVNVDYDHYGNVIGVEVL